MGKEGREGWESGEVGDLMGLGLEDYWEIIFLFSDGMVTINKNQAPSTPTSPATISS